MRTLPPGGVGDRGQRFEVRATGYPTATENVVGWCADQVHAVRMALGILKAPGCMTSEVYDRLEKRIAWSSLDVL